MACVGKCHCLGLTCLARGTLIKKGGPPLEMKGYGTGAVRHQDPNKLDFEGFLSPLVLEEFAEYMNTHRVQADGKLRDSDNWQKGMSRADYMKSLIRHAFAAWRLHRGWSVKKEVIGGVLREPTMKECLNGILFNVQGYMHELLIGRDVGQSAIEKAPAPGEESKGQKEMKSLKEWADEYNAKKEQELAIQKPRVPSAPNAWPSDGPVRLAPSPYGLKLKKVFRPDHVCGLQGYCPGPPHFDSCPACVPWAERPQLAEDTYRGRLREEEAA